MYTSKFAHAMSLTYIVKPAFAVSESDLADSAELFSNHYGRWLQTQTNVQLSAQKLREGYLFDNDQCTLVQVRDPTRKKLLVGHAFLCLFWLDEARVSWVTQLCVHTDYRSRGVARRLCYIAWNNDQHYLCGLATSHPHAVRALERATGEKCTRDLAQTWGDYILKKNKIPYLREAKLVLDDDQCLIDTRFAVDHSDVNIALDLDTDWSLGSLRDGMEFFAIATRVRS